MTKQRIIAQTTTLFAHGGIDGISMRDLAEKVGVAPSVLYYYFADKDTLLRAMFDMVNTKLGKDRAALPVPRTAHEMLLHRIEFQFEHAEEVVAVLKYYLMYRKQFEKNKLGYIPEKGYLHILEALRFGIAQKEFMLDNVDSLAKVITHTINGYILEYFPTIPPKKERKKLIEEIDSFIYPGIMTYGKS